MQTMKNMNGGAHRLDDPSCPICGSAVVGRRFGAGTTVSWCSRCSWSRIEEPDGNVYKEAAAAPRAIFAMSEGPTS